MSPLWIAILIGLLLFAAAVFAWRYTRQQSSGRDDRYTAEKLVEPEQAKMLAYLRDTFPGQVVIPNVPLKSMLSIRRASDRKRAEQRLEQHKVDYVVCNPDGHPAFAFDVEQYHLSDAKGKAFQAKLKNRILKSAGVRLVYIKDSLRRMPSPSDFRKQLNLAALPQPGPELQRRATDRESVKQELESRISEFDQLHATSEFKESEVMGLSGLMELDEMLNRPGKRKLRRDRDNEGPESLQSGQSGFDGGTVDVRGG
jgi:hypothetical protein